MHNGLKGLVFHVSNINCFWLKGLEANKIGENIIGSYVNYSKQGNM